MSMSDERTSLARSLSRAGQAKSKAPVMKAPVAKAKAAAPGRKPAPSIPGVGTPANGNGGVLPGLAAFGKMQGFAAPAAKASVPRPPAPRVAAPKAAAPRREAVIPMPVPEPEAYASEESYYEEAAAGYEASEDQFEGEFEATDGAAGEAGYAEEADYSAGESGFAFSDEDLEAMIRDGSQAHVGGQADDAAASNGDAASEDESEQAFSDFGASADQTFVFEDEPEDAAAASNGFDSGYEEDFDNKASRALKTFEAGYEGPPEIRLGDYSPASEEEDAPQPFFPDGTEADAGYLDQEFDASTLPPAKEGRGRKMMMVSSAMAGALALGGAFAFAYKSGDGAGDAPPPLIQADARPAKVAPAEPGGKEFPHKNKLIYERLNGAGEPGTEQLVPRQEQVAQAPALRPGEGQKQAALLQGSDSPQVTASAPEAPEAPRKVRTLLVRPDGTLVQPAAEQAAAAPAPATAAPAPLPLPQAAPASQQASLERPSSSAPVRPVVLGAEPAARADAAPAPVAAAEPAPEPAAQIPPPLSKPAPPPVAVASAPAAPAPQAAASDGTFVVQVAARKSQADALAAFADLQQKYPDLLSGYRPMIQRADLGDRGVWYRLRVGPMNEKTAAANLCDKLKGAGIGSCLVREE